MESGKGEGNTKKDGDKEIRSFYEVKWCLGTKELRVEEWGFAQ